MDRTSRLFIVELDLLDKLSGHFFNQAFGFKQAAEEYGIECFILVSKNTDINLANKLNALRIIELPSIFSLNTFYSEFNFFTKANHELYSTWKTIEDIGITNHDMVLITSSRPNVIYSLGVWLNKLTDKNRPTVFIRFFQHEYLNLETMIYNEISKFFQFSGIDLSLKLGQEKVFFTANNKEFLSPLGRVCSRRVFYMPFPKYYINNEKMIAPNIENPIIYIHLNWSSGIFLELIELIIRNIIAIRTNVKFLVKYTAYVGTYPKISADLIDKFVELIPAELLPNEHLNTIARSHIVFLPYDKNNYQIRSSGVFLEAVSMGKVIVIPQETSMSKQIELKNASGFCFDPLKPEEALLHALNSLEPLLQEAKLKMDAFRNEHNCKKNLELMYELATRDHDMQPTYTIGTSINFSSYIDSQCFMKTGWSVYESKGIWSEGPEAKLFFRLETETSNPITFKLCFTPFVYTNEQKIIILINNTYIDEWNFLPFAQAVNSTRDLTIPPELIPKDGVIDLTFQILNPTSPHQLKLSEDTRLLGIMLHNLISC